MQQVLKHFFNHARNQKIVSKKRETHSNNFMIIYNASFQSIRRSHDTSNEKHKKFIKPFEIYMKIFFDKHFCVDFIGKNPIFLNRTINFKIYQPKKTSNPQFPLS